MTLREVKQTLRQWVAEQFSDQKLAEVYAFNRDGKMRYASYCQCLLGVTSAVVLHDKLKNCNSSHYFDCLELVVGAYDCEWAYQRLGEPGSEYRDGTETDLRFFIDDGRRRRRFSAILRAEIRRRDRAREIARLNQEQQLVGVLNALS